MGTGDEDEADEVVEEDATICAVVRPRRRRRIIFLGTIFLFKIEGLQ